MGEGGGEGWGVWGGVGRCSQAVFTGLLEQPRPSPACWANRVVVGESGMGSPSVSHQSLGRLPPGAGSDGFPSWASQPQQAQGSLPQFALAR